MLNAPLVAEAFGLGTPIAEPRLHQHTVSETWKLETTSGAYLVKRLWRGEDPHWAPELLLRVDFERRARALCIPTPRPVKPLNPAYGTVGRVPDMGLFRVYEWLEHRKLLPSDDVSAWAGEMLAKLHTLSPLDHVPEPRYYGIYPTSTWAAWLAQGTVERRAWAPDLRDAMDTILQITSDLRESFRAAGDHVITHGDVEPYNVLVTPRGLVLIDWDSVGPESASQELGQVAVSFAEGRIDRVRRVLDAYASVGGSRPTVGPGLFMRRIGASLGNMTSLIEGTLSGEPLTGWMSGGNADQRIRNRIVRLPEKVAAMHDLALALSE